MAWSSSEFICLPGIVGLNAIQSCSYHLSLCVNKQGWKCYSAWRWRVGLTNLTKNGDLNLKTWRPEGLTPDDWQLMTRQMADNLGLMTNNWQQMMTDNWQLTNDDWQLRTDVWRLMTDDWWLTNDNWWLMTDNWRLTTDDWQLTADDRRLKKEGWRLKTKKLMKFLQQQQQRQLTGLRDDEEDLVI